MVAAAAAAAAAGFATTVMLAAAALCCLLPLLPTAEASSLNASSSSASVGFGFTRPPFKKGFRLQHTQRGAAVEQLVSTNRKYNGQPGSLYRCEPGRTGANCRLRKCPFSLGAPTDVTYDFLFTPSYSAPASSATAANVNNNNSNDGSQGRRPLLSLYPELSFEASTSARGMANRHPYLECGGRGECDRQTGQCRCFAGYTGEGCRRMLCPGDCSAHGRCLTDAAQLYHRGFFKPDRVPTVDAADNDALPIPLRYRTDSLFASENFWSANLAASCRCDAGYTGVDCSQRQCPTGDDPMTFCAEDLGVDVQEVQCHALPTNSSGNATTTTVWVSLGFQSTAGQRLETHPLPIDIARRTEVENARAMQLALEHLPNFVVPSVQVDATIEADVISFAVSFSDARTSGLQHLLHVHTDKPCGFGPSYFDNSDAEHFECEVLRRFDTEGVVLHNFEQRSRTSGGQAVVVNSSTGLRRMRENAVCSNRGDCDTDTGLCRCYTGFAGAACDQVTKYTYF